MDTLWTIVRLLVDRAVLPSGSRGFWRFREADPEDEDADEPFDGPEIPDRDPPWTRRRLQRDGRRRGRIPGDRELDALLLPLIEAARDPKWRDSVTDSAKEAIFLLDQLKSITRWDDGLRDSLVDLVDAAVKDAQRSFPANKKTEKRAHVVGVVTELVGQYLADGASLPRPFLRVLEPAIGLAVDWTVALNKLSKSWEPDTTPTFPASLDVLHRLAHVGLWCLGLLSRVEDLFRGQDRERKRVLASCKRLEAEAQRVKALLPHDRITPALNEIGTMIARFGKITEPHVRLIAHLIELSRSVLELDPDGRRDLAARATQLLLRQAYGDHPLVAGLIDSGIGRLLIGEVIYGAERIMLRNSVVA